MPRFPWMNSLPPRDCLLLEPCSLRFVKNCRTFRTPKCLGQEQKEPQLQCRSPLRCLCSDWGYDSPRDRWLSWARLWQVSSDWHSGDLQVWHYCHKEYTAVPLFDFLTLPGKLVDTQNKPVAFCFTSASCWLTDYGGPFKPALRPVPYNCTDKHLTENANKKYFNIPSQ